MKRRCLLKLALFLVLGAIVNVAAAWGCTCNEKAGITREITPSEIRDMMSVQSVVDWDDHWPIVAESERRFGLQRVAAYDADDRYGGDPSKLPLPQYRRPPFLIWVNAGWPLHALNAQYGFEQDSVNGRPNMRTTSASSIQLASRRFPVRPLWPGFAINTVFYAVVLWLLFAAPFALRRRRRIRRGLCPKCAYPVGTSDVCTECGAAVNE